MEFEKLGGREGGKGSKQADRHKEVHAKMIYFRALLCRLMKFKDKRQREKTVQKRNKYINTHITNCTHKTRCRRMSEWIDLYSS